MKKMYWWIGTTAFNHLGQLKVFSGESELKDLEDFIYFDNQEDADIFLQELKNFIKIKYPGASRFNW